MRGAYETPQEACPWCGQFCSADFVDIGIGMQQCGPYYCPDCKASEIGPYDTPRELTSAEQSAGWYAPQTPVGDSANTFRGIPVGHLAAKQLYNAGMLDEKPETTGAKL